jgi:uncharacterized protein YndB with AHSA1/START domain
MKPQTQSAQDSSMLVQKTIHVNAPPARAFEVFVQQIGQWWPLSTHRIGAQAPETAVIEPRVGGRWFERASDGTECNWGSVKVWVPPERLVLAWSITADWKYDAALDTEVEVRFIGEGSDRTRVELEHRRLERYGDKAFMMKGIFDSDGGWSGLLGRYAQQVDQVR